MPSREALLIGAYLLLLVGSALVLVGVYLADAPAEGFVKEGRRKR